MSSERPTLRVETLVQTSANAGEAAFEPGRIVQLCRTPHSIAEVSAKLELPLGVVRVLVGDLVAEDQLIVHHNDPVDIELSVLTRMIDRVRSL